MADREYKPGKFNVDTIVSQVANNPLLIPNRFEVIVTGPVVINKQILFNCHRCDIPSHSIGSFEHSNIGPKRKIPNEELYDDLSMSFYNNQHLDEIRVMDEWLKFIGGNTGMRMIYYNDLISDMIINIYDPTEKRIAEVKIYEAYPIGISELELSYAGEIPSDITVNWAYHSFDIWAN